MRIVRLPTKRGAQLRDLRARRLHQMKKTPKLVGVFGGGAGNCRRPKTIGREPTFIDSCGVGWKQRWGSKWRVVTQFNGVSQGVT